jgi:hypothetical protein
MTDTPSSGQKKSDWEPPAHHLSHGAMASNQIPWPFPFFGAGAATYYEWAEVIIRLVHPPSEEQLAFIHQSAPPPLKSSPVVCHWKMLLAGGGQFINRDIERAYGSSEGKESPWNDADDDDNETDDDNEADDNDDFDPDDPRLYASDEAEALFNQDIERWLHEIHRACPIEFAFRREDHEAEGTDYSAWHTASIPLASALIATWHDDPMTYEQSAAEKELFAYAVSGIMSYAGVTTLPDPLLRFLFPQE